MLTGQPAFKGTTAVAILSSVLHDDPPSLGELGILITPGLDLIVQRCLEKQAADRFQGAKDLAIALETLGSATDSITIPFGSFWRAGAKKLRRIWPYALTAIAFALIGAYVW